MRIPDQLFAVINPTVRLLLRSPLHWFWSQSLMLITFTGRKSGRTYTTPVRYLRSGQTVRCFTSSENKWWRNLREGAEVSLLIRGKHIACRAQATTGNPRAIQPALAQFLKYFPQDAPYYGVQLDGEGKPLSGDLARASDETVMVEADISLADRGNVA